MRECICASDAQRVTPFHPNPRKPMKLFRPALTFAAPIIGAFAQTIPSAPASSSNPEPEAVILTPFEVRADQDRGYLAQSTASGSRLNGNLKDTPAPISV